MYSHILFREYSPFEKFEYWYESIEYALVVLELSAFCREQYCKNSVICSFEEAYIKDTIFKNCLIVSANWERTNLYSVIFESCLLKRLNFEYAIFGNIHFYNTAIPFIFGGPEYILSTNDNVTIMSKIKPMTAKQYTEYLYVSLEFFSKTNNWFPAVNILLALGYKDRAYDMILQGANELIHIRKFRTLRYLIILAKRTSILSYADKAHLFQELGLMIQLLETDSTIDSYDKRMYISSIRSLLLPTELGAHFLTVKTNIKQDDTETIDAIYKMIETIATNILEAPHKITISHNSPYILDVLLALSPQIISGAAAVLAAVLPNTTNKSKNKSDVETLKEAIAKYRPDLDASMIQNIICSISRLEPALNNVDIQIIQTTLPPESSSNE